MADRQDSERLKGFGNRLTDGQTFAILELLSRLTRLNVYRCDKVRIDITYSEDVMYERSKRLEI